MNRHENRGLRQLGAKGERRKPTRTVPTKNSLSAQTSSELFLARVMEFLYMFKISILCFYSSLLGESIIPCCRNKENVRFFFFTDHRKEM